MATSDHLVFTREQPVNAKRPPGGFPQSKNIPDLPKHGKKLLSSLITAKEKSANEIGGYDDRLLFKIEVEDFRAGDLEYIPGVEILTQEDKGVFLVFSSEQGLEEFEARLSSLINGEQPVRQNLLEALENFDAYSAEDRKGWALKHSGFPYDDAFMLDVELWPLGNFVEREKLTTAFEDWLSNEDIEKLDSVKQDAAIIYRLRVTLLQADLLLHHRDIRTVDLPPSIQMDISLLHTDIQDIPEPPAPRQIRQL